jgi:hypothetical protein
MASIKISNLYPAGSELFKDSESFMNELGDRELGSINGGIRLPSLLPSPTPYSPRCYPTLLSPFCKPMLTLPLAH